MTNHPNPPTNNRSQPPLTTTIPLLFLLLLLHHHAPTALAAPTPAPPGPNNAQPPNNNSHGPGPGGNSRSHGFFKDLDNLFSHVGDRLESWDERRHPDGHHDHRGPLVDFRPTFNSPECIGVGVSVCDPIHVGSTHDHRGDHAKGDVDFSSGGGQRGDWADRAGDRADRADKGMGGEKKNLGFKGGHGKGGFRGLPKGLKDHEHKGGLGHHGIGHGDKHGHEHEDKHGHGRGGKGGGGRGGKLGGGGRGGKNDGGKTDNATTHDNSRPDASVDDSVDRGDKSQNQNVGTAPVPVNNNPSTIDNPGEGASSGKKPSRGQKPPGNKKTETSNGKEPGNVREPIGGQKPNNEKVETSNGKDEPKGGKKTSNGKVETIHPPETTDEEEVPFVPDSAVSKGEHGNAISSNVPKHPVPVPVPVGNSIGGVKEANTAGSSVTGNTKTGGNRNIVGGVVGSGRPTRAGNGIGMGLNFGDLRGVTPGKMSDEVDSDDDDSDDEGLAMPLGGCHGY